MKKINNNKLRPQTLREYINQKYIKAQLMVAIKGAKKRNEPLDHILFYGGAGLGKTTLAQIIATEMGGNIITTNGATLGRTSEMVSIMLSLKEKDILFVDEIHRLPRQLEESIYPILEDFKLMVTVGEGLSAKPITFDIPPFTFIGATTRTGLLTKPLLDRFSFHFNLEPYPSKDLEKIVSRTADILKINITYPGIKLLAGVARGTPRIANHLVKFARDYLDGSRGTAVKISESLRKQQIDPTSGLMRIDRRVLSALVASKMPLGLTTLGQITGEEKDTIESTVEPFLVREGYIIKTRHGRMATIKAKKYIKEATT